MDLGLLLMCVISFAAVFTLLTVLSVLMSVLTAIFPAKATPPAFHAAGESETDAAVLAAITTTMNKIYPGASVTKIEEVK